MIAIDLVKVFKQILVTFSCWALIFAPFFLSKRFTQAFIRKKKFSRIHVATFGDKVKKYLLRIVLVLMFSIVAWTFRGQELKEKHEYGLRIFFTLLLPSLFGVYRAYKTD